MEVSESVRSDPWQIYHVDELNLLPVRRWLVDAQIPEQGLAVLYGPPAAGKSFLALDYSLRLSQELSVVYVAAEGQSGYPKRVMAWRTHHDQWSQDLHFCFSEVSIIEDASLSAFIRRIEPLKPQIVILDTLARCFGDGDENSARDMGKVLKGCARIQTELAAAVLVVHYVNKQGEAERGSSALRGAADTMMSLTNAKGVLRLASSKTKDSAPFPDQYYRLEAVALPDGDSSCVLTVLEDRKTASGNGEDRLLQCLAQGPRKVSILSQELGIPEGSLYKKLANLEAAGLIEKPGHGKPYVLTEAGRACLAA